MTQIEIIKDNLVLKEDALKTKDDLILKWLKISELDLGYDRQYFHTENDKPYQKTFIVLSVILGIILSWFFIYIFISLNTGSYDTEFVFFNMFNNFFYAFALAIGIGLIIILFIKIKKSVQVNAALRDLNRVQTIIIREKQFQYISRNYRLLFKDVLDNINFEATIHNFRNLDKDSRISVRLARINNQEAAVIKILK